MTARLTDVDLPNLSALGDPRWSWLAAPRAEPSPCEATRRRRRRRHSTCASANRPPPRTPTTCSPSIAPSSRGARTVGQRRRRADLRLSLSVRDDRARGGRDLSARRRRRRASGRDRVPRGRQGEPAASARSGSTRSRDRRRRTPRLRRPHDHAAYWMGVASIAGSVHDASLAPNARQLALTARRTSCTRCRRPRRAPGVALAGRASPQEMSLATLNPPVARPRLMRPRPAR